MSPHDFARLVDSHGPALILYARQWCHVPQDVVQDAFLKLFALGKPPEQVVPWLYRVVRNGAIDAAKTARHRRQREQAVALNRPERWFVEPVVDGLDAQTAVAAMQELPLEQREVLVARIWGGLSFEEIAALADCSASSAHRRFTAGIETLRQQLGETCLKNLPNT